MYKIDYKNKRIKVNAEDTLVWINTPEGNEEEYDPIEFSFKDLLVVWRPDFLHNWAYSEFMIEVTGEEGDYENNFYTFLGETSFIKQMHKDFSKIKEELA